MNDEMTARAVRARVLAKGLAELDGDMETMELIDEVLDFLEDEYSTRPEEPKKPSRIWDAVFVFGLTAMLLCASGIDLAIQDPTANYIGCVVGLALMLIGNCLKRD